MRPRVGAGERLARVRGRKSPACWVDCKERSAKAFNILLESQKSSQPRALALDEHDDPRLRLPRGHGPSGHLCRLHFPRDAESIRQSVNEQPLVRVEGGWEERRRER